MGEVAAPPHHAARARRVGIVGLGLIGGSIALALRARQPEAVLVEVERDDSLGALAAADLIVLAAPVRENIRILQALPSIVAGRALVTDVGSTKREIVAASRSLAPRLVFVGGHPMAGGAAGGRAHARADLFEGKRWILTPEHDSEEVRELESFVALLGARVHRMSAEDHDRVMAAVSHLPQFVASALMATAGERAAAGLALSGNGLVDTTRLAESAPDIWRDIASTNADEIEPALDALIGELTELRRGLRDPGAIDRLFARAREWRARLAESRRL